jgi:hypothetical protein
VTLKGWRVSVTLLRVPLKMWWHAEYKEYESAKLRITYRRLQVGPVMLITRRPKP